MATLENEHNLLEILGIAGREDSITNLLAYCYNNSPKFRSTFMRAIGMCDSYGEPNGQAYTRVSTGDSGVPDLVIVKPYINGPAIVIIENKLGAAEGNDQTIKYGSVACLNNLKNRYELIDNIEPRYVFLTLLPDQHPQSEQFKPVTYESFLEEREDWPVEEQGNSLVVTLTKAFLQVLARIYKEGCLDPEANLFDQIGDSLYAFLSFARSVTTNQLIYRGGSQARARGHRSYLAAYGKREWMLSKIDKSQYPWRLDPETCFDIHVELDYRVSLECRKLSMFLHYETRPYYSVKNAHANINEQDYIAYEQQRARFVAAFQPICPNDWNPTNELLQVAKASFSFEDLSVRASRECVSRLLDRISTKVDQALATTNHN